MVKTNRVKKIERKFKRYIGNEIIATRQCLRRSLTEEPSILVGITRQGKMHIIHAGHTITLHSSFSKDNYWILYEEALKPKNNPLNKWKGKIIRRNKPAVYVSTFSDYSFMNEPVVLVSASKHHLVIEEWKKKFVLGPEFANPDDWELAE